MIYPRDNTIVTLWTTGAWSIALHFQFVTQDEIIIILLTGEY